jgi:hypothetical protein
MLDPLISDVAPADGNLTGYDQQHLVTYLRPLDAEQKGQTGIAAPRAMTAENDRASPAGRAPK